MIISAATCGPHHLRRHRLAWTRTCRCFPGRRRLCCSFAAGSMGSAGRWPRGAPACLRRDPRLSEVWARRRAGLAGTPCLETAALALGQFPAASPGQWCWAVLLFQSFVALQGEIESAPVWWGTFCEEQMQPPAVVGMAAQLFQREGGGDPTSIPAWTLT